MNHPGLSHSMFHDVFFPPEVGQGAGDEKRELMLQRFIRYQPPLETEILTSPIVIFDFETTGLDSATDRIIEIGGIKMQNGETIGEFSYLIDPGLPITSEVTKITGITPDMLEGQPRIEDVLPEFLSFIEGSILVAHNADFDMAFLKNSCQRMGYQLDWPCFCTLKLARVLHPDLESRNLDTLAAQYGLKFEARHRSIGDCKVTGAVLLGFLNGKGEELTTWAHLQPFASGA